MLILDVLHAAGGRRVTGALCRQYLHRQHVLDYIGSDYLKVAHINIYITNGSHIAHMVKLQRTVPSVLHSFTVSFD